MSPRDMNDLLREEGVDAVRLAFDRNRQRFNGDANTSADAEWPKPKELPDGLLPVDAFRVEFLPKAFGPWIYDISDRLQCPPDYAAIAAITAFGSVIGRRAGVGPQMRTDWVAIPNLWGMFIGRPGMLKSPAMNEALKPLHRLEADAAKQNEINRAAYKADIDAFSLRKSVAASLTKSKLKDDSTTKIDLGLGPEPEEPAVVRYCTNDTTYEGLGELLISNPNGILVERDELMSLLKHLDKEDQASARGFYLSGAEGSSAYSFDRIVRGHRHVGAICISVLGNTQPARAREYVRTANLGGAGGDGLIQRFALLAWPDAPGDWKDVDRYPDNAARERAWQTFERASKLDTRTVLNMGA